MIVAVWVTITVSEVSVAVKTGAPEVVDVTVKVTIPDVVERPEEEETVSVDPLEEARVAVFPG